MKLMCINTNGWYQPRGWFSALFFGKTKDVNGPSSGDFVTETGGYWEEGIYYYYLKEWPPKDASDGWEAECFVPVREEEFKALLDAPSVGKHFHQHIKFKEGVKGHRL